MDRVVPSSFPTSTISSDDKNRKKFATVNSNLPKKSTDNNEKNNNEESYTDEQVLLAVKEINAYFSSFGQNLLVLFRKNDHGVALQIINTKDHSLIREIDIQELFEVARNLRNHKMTLIQRDV